MNGFYTTVLMALGLLMQHAPTKTFIDDKKSSTFYLKYDYAGLGGNIGTSQPTIRIFNNQLTYTFEVNSYYVERDFEIDTISSAFIRQGSVDSILNLVRPFMGKTTERSNYCIMSGGTHFLTVAFGSDTAKFQLNNTLEPTAFEVIKILNKYLKEDQSLCTVEDYEDYIRMEEDCHKRFRKK